MWLWTLSYNPLRSIKNVCEQFIIPILIVVIACLIIYKLASEIRSNKITADVRPNRVASSNWAKIARVLFWIAATIEMLWLCYMVVGGIYAYFIGIYVFGRSGELDCLPWTEKGWDGVEQILFRAGEILVYVLPCVIYQLIYACVIDITQHRKLKNKE